MHPLSVRVFCMHPLCVCGFLTWFVHVILRLYLGSCVCMANTLLSELLPLPCISPLFVHRPTLAQPVQHPIGAICPQTMTDSLFTQLLPESHQM